MDLTESQYNIVKAGINHPRLTTIVEEYWSVYDELRESGELPEVGSNPHVPTLLFALTGYPFAVRDGLEQMQNDLDGVIEKLRDDTVQSPWMP